MCFEAMYCLQKKYEIQKNNIDSKKSIFRAEPKFDRKCILAKMQKKVSVKQNLRKKTFQQNLIFWAKIDAWISVGM